MSRVGLSALERREPDSRARRPCGRSNGASGNMPSELELIDDLPETIPITQRELDVIETYLGGLLDSAF